MSRYSAVSDFDYDEEHGNPVPRQARSQKRQTAADRCKADADPLCEECGGDGIVSYTSQQHADGYVDVACECVERKRRADSGPADDGDAWAGGFADNH